MADPNNITPPRVPLTDAKTGLISREWYRFFFNLFSRTGGGGGITPPASGGTGANNVATAGTVLYGNGATFQPTAVGTVGQVLTSNGSGTPTWSSAGAGSVTSVDVSGGTTGLTTSGGPVTSNGVITLAGTLGVANGGTGVTTTPPAGGVAYGNGTTLAYTAAGTVGYVLTSNGTGAPTWSPAGSGSGTVTSVDASGGTTGLSFTGGPVTSSGTLTLGGTLAIANGGTNGIATPTGGAVAYGTGTAYAFTAAGTSGQALFSAGAGTPTWGPVVTSVSGSGGTTGLTLSGGPITTTGTLTLGGTLAIANGGTNGSATPTAGGVPYGTGTAYAFTAAGAAGQVLKSNGASPPTWSTVGSGTVTSVDVVTAGTGLTSTGGPITGSGSITLGGTLNIATGGTNSTATPTAGGVAYGTGTAYAFTAAGTAGMVLSSNGTGAPTWIPATGTGTVTNVDGGTTGLSFSTPTTTPSMTGILFPSNGGTGANLTPTAGGVPYGTGTAMAFLGAGTSGQFLKSNGAGAPSWSAGGTVSSVDVSGGTTGLTTSGGPITSTGTITLAGTLGLANGGTGKTTATEAFGALNGFSTTATAAGTTTLGLTSAQYQIFTGSTTQTILLPNTTALFNGWQVRITNASTGNLTVQTSAGVTIATITPAHEATYVCIDATSNVAGSWRQNVTATALNGSGSIICAQSPLITSLSLSGGGTGAGTQPLAFSSGSLLTSPISGAVEFDGSTFFATENTTTGRGMVLPEYFYRQTANGTTTTAATIADFFPANSSISLLASTYYEIECFCYFLKTTAGTVTFTMTASSAPTWMNGSYIASPVGGINATGAVATGSTGSTGATTAAWAASGSLTTAVNHGFRFTIRILTNAATNWRMRYTSNTGTTQSLIGSYYRVRTLPSASTGTFVA